ncbi:DUF5681 domain-containing protein [Bradyrhizobium sp. Gha]|uniref:DUF5681 domain-containing protein n=1 Tax=Bradyrhizobium sp. Gha TaxID=1855318 RepID=UPI0008E057A8|nr:DUF5681 domain-containing protein [Bradyrhizobium sp. Gha]SFJ72055.1 hypothetical protein SAMN05216525_13327 [Bradyrhizobium sp. Gha]
MAEKFTDDDARDLQPVVQLRPKGNGNLKTARPWQPGQSGNPAGRRPGSRNKLSEDFLQGLHRTWQKHGDRALEAMAIDDPSNFCRLVAGLMPRQIDLSVGVDAAQFVTTFREAVELLGNEPPRKRAKVIEAEVIDADDQ